jgi:hypothetical protein
VKPVSAATKTNIDGNWLICAALADCERGCAYFELRQDSRCPLSGIAILGLIWAGTFKEQATFENR